MSSDVSVSLGVTGREVVLGAFSEVGAAGQNMAGIFGGIAGRLAGLAAGYLSVSGAVHAFNSVMDRGGQLADFSEQTGIAVGRLVVLGRAFENNGMHAEDLGQMINRMQRFITSVGDESSAAATKLAAIGIRATELRNMSPDEQFRTIAQAIAGIEDPGQRAAMAMEIFGRSGGRLLAFFNDFDGSVSQANQEVGSFASVMNNSASSFDSIGDGITAIIGKITEFTAGILSDAVPAIRSLVDSLRTVDATEFGMQFSSGLAQGINVALSVFRNPGNLFLVFGDSLVVVLQTAVNTLLDSMAYVFQWISNYASELIPGYGDLLSATFTAALHGVLSFFRGQMGQSFTDLGALIPGTLGQALTDAGQALISSSQESSDIANQALAGAWDRIAGAAARATEQTSYQRQDWLNVAASSERLRDHIQIASESGASFLNDMSSSREHASDIAGILEDLSVPAPEWWEQGPPTDLFSDMMAPDWWNQNQLANQSQSSWFGQGGMGGEGSYGGGVGPSGGSGGVSGGGSGGGSGSGGGGAGGSEISATLRDILACLRRDIAPALPIQVMS
jgi:hypothetical protein